jgi:phenylacetate-coenzyme A ligase PaaK-like adenylate-forming protein
MNSQSSHNRYAEIFDRLPEEFDEKAVRLFRFQYRENLVYREFSERFKTVPSEIHSLLQIPFLPVSLFKSKRLMTGNFQPEIIFESSGTTGQTRARHFVREAALYRESFVKGFNYFFGDPGNYCILGLLPAYLEREGSSLIYMVDELIRLSGHALSGFYLNEFDNLHTILENLEKREQRTILIGVSFALLDFTEKYSMQLSNTLVMETGGMKGRRKELTRPELHEILKNKLGLNQVYSEYGMTELLSQAYSVGEGLYKPVPWMKMFVRDEDDPLHVSDTGEGLLNIVDLANRDSIGFIATDDIVKIYGDGSFEILGRMDQSDVRGCSLLVA